MTVIAELLVAATPFLAIGALLGLAGRVRERRELRIARQIALTDAIHRELGAAAAPEVMRGWTGTWTVRMAAPLRREVLVGSLTRITHDFFAKLDGADVPRLRILFTEQEPIVRAGAPRSLVEPRPRGFRPSSSPSLGRLAG